MAEETKFPAGSANDLSESLNKDNADPVSESSKELTLDESLMSAD